MQEFNYIENLNLQRQDQTNWCWASCLQAINNYLYPNKTITQKKIVANHYGLSTSLPNSSMNYTIPGNKISTLFKNYNIETEEVSANLVRDYNSVTTYLNDTKCPILLGAEIGGNTKHLVLVMGHGYCDSINYILIGDPEGKIFYAEHLGQATGYGSSKYNRAWIIKPNVDRVALPKLLTKNSFNEIIFEDSIKEKITFDLAGEFWFINEKGTFDIIQSEKTTFILIDDKISTYHINSICIRDTRDFGTHLDPRPIEKILELIQKHKPNNQYLKFIVNIESGIIALQDEIQKTIIPISVPSYYSENNNVMSIDFKNFSTKLKS